MLEILFAVAILIILFDLLLIAAIFLIIFKSFWKLIGEDTLNSWNLESFIPKDKQSQQPPQTREVPINDSNQYTPTSEVPINEIPLDQFTPNFDKPIKVVYEESGEDHGMSIKEDKDES